MEAPRQKIGQYLISKKLGEGGMGAVFLGEHEFTGRQAAIKMISGGHFESEESIQRLKDEARALGKLSDPNIVNVLDFFPEGGSFFLVLEFVNGVSLDKVFKVSEINLFQAVDTAIKAGRGIAAAHRHGILHRDIKPQNVMVSQTGEVKLMDFGLAKFADATSKTRTGVIMGTPRYMSPEQCRGTPLDARSDLYSFGVLVYRLACGREPFIEGDTFAIASKHVFERPPAPEAFNPAMPPSLSAVILKALAKDPAERHPDMDTLLRELEREREALAAGGREDTAPLTATLALSQLREAAAGPGTIPTPGPRTPSGLRFTGVERVGGGSHPPAPATRPLGAPSFSGAGETPRGGRRAGLLAAGLLAVAALAGAELLRRRGIARPGAPRRSESAAGFASAAAAPADDSRNRWIAVRPPGTAVLLGVEANAVQRGFRPERRVSAPSEPYEIQQHEVSWGEFDPWLTAHLGVTTTAPAWLPAEPSARRALPVSGVSWGDAQLYCKNLGGSLPSEEQWEYAARGAELRPSSWGSQRPDAQRMKFFAGAAGTPAAVMTAEQDRTPGPEAAALHDLTGNVQEWTLDLWREDRAGQDEAWVQEGEASYRAIRGLPLAADPPREFPPVPAAWREPLCATGACVQKSQGRLQSVGFRCARPAR